MGIDFKALCREYGIPFKEEVDGWINIDCPMCRHKGTRGFKGGVNLAGSYYHCWNCGGSSIDSVVASLLDVGAREAQSIIDRHSGHIVTRRRRERQASSVELPITELTSWCAKYLRGRRYDPEYLHRKYGVSGALIQGPWAGRVIIPIYSNGKLVTWQGRAMLSKKACEATGTLRYKFPPPDLSVADPKSVLYNIDSCRGLDSVIVVEGAFDCWRIGDGCVATLGTSVSDRQVAQLKAFKRLFLLFDPEKEAQERAEAIAKTASNRWGIEAVVIDTGLDHDPGDMTDDEVSYLRKEVGI